MNIGEATLEVDKLDAKVSLKAQLGNFINIDVGTNVHLENIKLNLKDVDAEAHLKVNLEKVEHILIKAIGFLEQHPEVIKNLESFKEDKKE